MKRETGRSRETVFKRTVLILVASNVWRQRRAKRVRCTPGLGGALRLARGFGTGTKPEERDGRRPWGGSQEFGTAEVLANCWALKLGIAGSSGVTGLSGAVPAVRSEGGWSGYDPKARLTTTRQSVPKSWGPRKAANARVVGGPKRLVAKKGTCRMRWTKKPRYE